MSDRPPPVRFDLAGAFRRRQEKLASDLGLGDIATHPGTKGDDAELNWRYMLDQLLPTRYGVSKAFVVDSSGNQSGQIDIVVHDRHFSPLLFEVGDAKYIPAESVYAAFEVKQELDKANLEYAATKIASVRTLNRTSAHVPHAGGRYDPIQPRRIIGGVLSRRSDWTPPFGDAFKDCLRGLDVQGTDAVEFGLDLGCAAEDGSFSVDRKSDDPRLATIDRSEGNLGLISFVMSLLQKLQAVGTVPAIDYDAYLRTVSEDLRSDA